MTLSLFLDGAIELALANNLVKLSIEETPLGGTRLEATFNNGEGANFLFFDNPNLRLGAALKLAIPDETIFEGHIGALKSVCASAAAPLLVIEARDLRAGLPSSDASRLVLGAALREFSGEITRSAAGLPDGCCSGVAESEGSLRAGAIVKMTGVGAPFEGAYRLTSSRRLFDLAQGWRTSFDGERMKLIYKIVSAVEWRAADEAGVFHGAAIDLVDGYIHFSSADQVEETAAKHFAGKDDLLLVAIDAAKLGDALKWEISRGGALFPHLYAPLSLDAVTRVDPLPLRDGRHDFTGLL